MSLQRLSHTIYFGLLSGVLAQAAPTTVQHFDTRHHAYEGSPAAPVKMVVFEDYKCPACYNFETRFLPELRKKYIATGKVQLFRFNYPFLADHLPVNDSMLAAEAVQCIYKKNGNAAALKMSGLLFENQGDESEVWATPAKLHELSAQIQGVNLPQVQRCLSSHETRAQIKADMAQGDKAGLQGTPSVYVNGKAVVSFVTPIVSEAIDKALHK